MKVFLDVGAHQGETVRAVRDPKYRFDRIYCFEPASACWQALEAEAAADPRVTLLRYGLWRRTCELPLYEPGSAGASLFEDKFTGSHRTGTVQPCRFVRATEWLRENLTDRDEVFMKLNCEGAECDIVEDLLDSGEFGRLRAVMIDFDIRKVPSLRHREAEVRSRLASAGFSNYTTAEEVMIGATHRDRIQHWLKGAGAEEASLGPRLRQVVYVAGEAARGHGEPLRGSLRGALRRFRQLIA